jgi:glycosyltransferase involved in cell wall biosynthesis
VKKNKIVFFTESMSVMGGMERVVDFLSVELSDKYDVHILTMNGSIGADFKTNAKIDTLGIDIIPDSLLNKIQRYYKTIIELKKYLMTLDNDSYFVANSPALCCSVMIVKTIYKISAKVILFEHNKFTFPGKFWQIVRKLTYNKAHRVIALTSDVHNKYLELGFPSVCIPNALTVSIGNTSKLEHKKVIAVGRLVYQKGFDLLLLAWKDVIRIHPDWVLEIVGDGPERSELIKISNELKISNNVIFYGETYDVQSRYSDASLFVLSSRYEGFGLVLVEALAHGLPCISFNCESGPNEIIKNNYNGFLVEPESVTLLTDYVNKYIQLTMDEKLKLSSNSLSSITKFKPENIINKWKEEVFND